MPNRIGDDDKRIPLIPHGDIGLVVSPFLADPIVSKIFI